MPDCLRATEPAQQRTAEKGNAFFIVMISVVLFAALMFSFSRGARQGGENLSEKQAQIAASDIISYAQKVERGVARVYARGYSESNISFENSYFAGNENASCTEDRCRVFAPQGGGIGYQPLAESWSKSADNWIFTGSNQVLGLGRDCAADECAELLMMIEDVPQSLCIAINEQLGLTGGGSAPPFDANVDTILFQSTFRYDAAADLGDEDASLSGVRTACFLETGNVYYFYHTLLER